MLVKLKGSTRKEEPITATQELIDLAHVQASHHNLILSSLCMHVITNASNKESALHRLHYPHGN